MGMRPPIDRLRQLFEFDFVTGVITRLQRPEADFSAFRHWRMWNRRYANMAAGNRRADGYVMVRVIIDGEKHDILAHILGWALHYGRWPEAELDHRDGIHHNNGIDNLREATRLEQMQNMALRSDRMGTAFDPRSGRYQALIGILGKKVHLGMFATKEEAHEAYLKAKAELHSFNPVIRDD